jgi:hypothetical protein
LQPAAGKSRLNNDVGMDQLARQRQIFIAATIGHRQLFIEQAQQQFSGIYGIVLLQSGEIG